MVGESDLESYWQTWKDLFLAAVKDNIPTKRLRGRNPVPWLTGAVINLIKKKETVRRKLKLHPSESLKVKFQTLRSQVKRAIKESRDEFFESANIEFKINPKRLSSEQKNWLKVVQHTTKCLHGLHSLPQNPPLAILCCISAKLRLS